MFLLSQPWKSISISRGRGLALLLAGFACATILSVASFAQSINGPLNFGNNFFVTGDYVVGGAYGMNVAFTTINGLPYTTGTINIPDADPVTKKANPGITGTKAVPAGAQIVAAFLYWQTVEKVGQPGSGKNGFFRPLNGGPQTGYPITGVAVNSHNATSFSFGQCSGSSTGKIVQTYRAEVLGYLPQDANGNVLANSTYEVRLPSVGPSTPLTLGATLVIIYRLLSPDVPLNSIVIYEGGFANTSTSSNMTQTVQGFYEAANAPVSRLTHIVGGGKNYRFETVYLNDKPLPPLYTTGQPFPGYYSTPATYGWDNTTWTFGPKSNPAGVAPGAASAKTMVVPSSSQGECVSWGAVIVSTTVQNSDGDGLLDVWKVPPAPNLNTPGYCDAAVNEGVCKVGDASWVDLPEAKLYALDPQTKGQKDVFVQLDYMCSKVTGADRCDASQVTVTPPFTNYSFDPRLTGAVDMMTNAFLAHGIHLHVNPVNPTGTTQPVHAIPEQTCVDTPNSPLCPFPNQPGVVDWKGGFEFLKNQPVNYPDESSCEQALNGPCIRRFQHGRKDSYHYAVFAHSSGRPNWGLQGGSLTSVMASGKAVIFTTLTAHGLCKSADPSCPKGIDRVTITDAITNPNLNGTYPVTGVSPAGVLTITQTSMANGTATYAFTQVRGDAPLVGDFVTIKNTTNGSGIFNVDHAKIAAVDVLRSTFTVNFNVNGFAPSAITAQLETTVGAQTPTAQTARAPFTFTINIGTSVSAGTSYTPTTDPNLSVTSGQAGSGSGFSDIGGADTLVTLGFWGNPADPASNPPGQSKTVQAGTLMHELGHTLGLTHGGFFYDNLAIHPQDYTPTIEANCKSNFQSVMNYMFQFDLLGKNGVLDFSSQQLSPLNETNLLPLDSTAAFATTSWYDLTPTGGVGSPAKHHCDSTPKSFSTDVTPIMYPHYNQDLPTAWPAPPLGAAGLDINFDGTIDTSLHGGYRGYDDWAPTFTPTGTPITTGIDLRQLGATGNDVVGGPGGVGFGPGGVGFGPGGVGFGPGGVGFGPGGVGFGPGGVGFGPGGVGFGPGAIVSVEIDFATANAVTRAPRNLTAIEDPSPRYIHLFWFPPTFGQIGSYNIYRQPPWVLGNPPTFSVPVSSQQLIFHNNPADPHFGEYEFVDKTATCNPSGYTYFVSAVQASPNPGQESGPSNTVSTDAQSQKPLTGCYTIATPPNVALTNFSFPTNTTFVQGTSIPVTWTLQDDDTGAFVSNLKASTLVAIGPIPNDTSCGSVPAGTAGTLTPLLLSGPAFAFSGPPNNQFTFMWDTTNFNAGCYFFQLNFDSGQPGQTTTSALTLLIFASDNTPHMTTTALPNGVVGTAYSNNGLPVTLQEAGGTGPTFTWSVVSGKLPPGISLGLHSGILVGTPCATGTYPFMVQVMDSLGNVSPQTMLTLVVAAAPVPLVNQPVVPESSVPGGTSAFMLTVNGTGFVSCSAVLWNGSARTTAFNSVTQQLTAAIPAFDVATFGTASVSVATTGSPTSNVDFFQITNPTTAVSLSRADYATGASPHGLISADFNADGKLDLAVTNSGSNTVSILLGNGDGTFAAATTLDTGSGSVPYSLIAGDFNNDGKLDLAVTNFANGTVSIFIGKGDGTFNPAVSDTVGSGPISVATGDFNGDGKLDLAVANQNDATVSILLGNGNGTFQAQMAYAAVIAGMGGLDVANLTVGDFNRDGKLDLAVTNPSSDQVSILLGNGDGTFPNLVSHSTGAAGSHPIAVNAADFSGDGILDLAITNLNLNTVAIFLGNGDGTFQPPKSYSTTNGAMTGPSAMTTGDFNGDGLVDLAITNQHDNSVSILLGNANGTFQSPLEFTTGNFASGVAAGDFNRDGRLDVAVADIDSYTVSVMLQPQVLLVPSALALGNVTVTGTSAPLVVILTNNGPAALTITSIAFRGSNPGDFTETDNCPTTSPNTLAAGLTCTISVTFSPTATGLRSATLIVTYPGTGSPQMVNVTGTGLPQVLLAPSVLAFGNVTVGTPTTSGVVLTNNGSSPLTITSIAFGGSNPGDFTETDNCLTTSTLAAGSSCTINVTFTPTTTGPRPATLVITDGASDSPQNVNITGTGQ